jgi:hypothetical protein
MGGQDSFHERQLALPRCIICNRIKQPLNTLVSADLQGMRCDMGCPGYTLDPPPTDGSATFLRQAAGLPEPLGEPMPASLPAPMPVTSAAAGPASTPVPVAVDLRDQLVDVIGRALCEVHFGA